MAWPRYVLYFAGVTLVTWLLTYLEIEFPGTLKLHVAGFAGDSLGTSEFSPIEIMQPFILCICGLLLAWVAHYCPSQRPLALLFGGLALVFLIRECDYFLDRYVIDNLWQALVGVALALLIAYSYRHRRRLRISWARIWPSPGLALWFAGALTVFVFVQLIGQEALWIALLGEHYQRIAKLAVEEFIELLGYFLWLIGTIEYAYQARAIAYREPKPAVQRRRLKRRRNHEGRY
jgi:hypothetical protein